MERFRAYERLNCSSHTSEMKIELMNMLLSSDEIVKCLYDNSPDFLECDLSNVDRFGLLYKNVFPFQAVPDVQTEEKTYLTASFRFDREETIRDFKIGRLYLYAFCHKNLVRTDYGVLRYDYLANKIEEQLQFASGPNWLGGMYMHRMVDTIIDSGGFYVGVELQFRFSDFM